MTKTPDGKDAGAKAAGGTPDASGTQALPLIGAQTSTAGGFAPVPGRAVALGAEAVQVFSSNPRMWRPQRPPSPEELESFTSGLREHRLPLFFHAIYMINLATPDEQLRQRSVGALAHSLALGMVAGAAGVVTHIGSHRGEGTGRGCIWAAGAISEAVAAAHETGATLAGGHHTGLLLPPLLLETGVGSGNGVRGRLEDLAEIIDALPAAESRPALGVCIDTAHLFAAGYAVHTADGLQATVDELARLQLLPLIRLVHLNDSSTPFGSRRDVHENPGDGCIGYEGLARVVRHPALARVPFVLETPGLEGHGPDAPNICIAKAMRTDEPAEQTARTILGRPFAGERALED